jgi:dienelactone hydrolase
VQLLDEVTTQGVVERAFRLEHDGEEVPGICWRPEGALGQTPAILLGHGGTQHKRAPNVLGLARRFVRHLGATAVALDAPGHGDRIEDPERARAARDDLTRRMASGGAGAAPRLEPPDPEAWAASHRRARAEWRATLDWLVDDGLAAPGKVGYWGLSMGTVIGLELVADEPRIASAVLGLAALQGWAGASERAAAAGRLSVPVLFVLQLDDQLMTRDDGLALFEAIGSQDKTLHAFPGGHVDTPLHERDAYDAFFARTLLG